MVEKNEHYNALPNGYMLDNFEIVKVLGAGGFGVAYLAKDTYLDEECVIKEYMPNDFSYRDSSSGEVYPTTPSNAENYEWGLNEFLNEAITIKKCKHKNIVEVIRFFKANNTAYIVMPYFVGSSLSELLALDPNETATEEEIRDIVIPLLEGLKVVHAQNIFHRDIKPSNIYICDEGNTPILIDFGAARFSLGSHSRSITTIVTPSYSPHEQYHQHGKQGAWTDIYSMGAVMYRLISGEMPIESPARVGDDPLIPAVEVGKGKYSAHLLAAIDHALAFKESDRPQSVDQWLAEINGEVVSLPKSNPMPIVTPSPTIEAPSAIPTVAWVIIVALVAGISVLAVKVFQNDNVTSPQPQSEEQYTQIDSGQNNLSVDAQARLEVLEAQARQEQRDAQEARDRRNTQAAQEAREQEEAREAQNRREVAARAAAQARREAEASQCRDGRLTSSQIQRLVYDKAAVGTRLDVSKPYSWVEFQRSNGEAYFKKANGDVSTGKWRLGNDQLCWCYGACTEYKCKYVEARNNCSVWYYIDTETGKETGKVDVWKEIE